MTRQRMTRQGLLTYTLIAFVLAAAATTVALWSRPGQRHLSADFPNTINLYPGAQVKVLGVPIGAVDTVAVHGTTVHVEMSYTDTVSLPATVHAAIVPPSIVGDRFIQLTPPYTGGPALADHSALGTDRTQVPLELDQTYRGLNTLAADLGPHGANSSGALSKLLREAAANLSGNGQALHDTIDQLSGAVDTLSASRADITQTVTHLAGITGTLAGDDDQVHALIENLATVSTQLNAQRGDLRDAADNLNQALTDVDGVLGDNRRDIHTTITGLRQVSATLAAHQHDLADVLDITPLGLSNVLDLSFPVNYDPAHPDAVNPAARAVAIPGKFDGLLQNLPNQLAYTLTAACAQLPAQQYSPLTPTCSALQTTGGTLGTLLQRAADPFLGPSLGTRRPSDLSPLLPGTPR
jgi:phospholipid/cholesterol/gamma-HCH transport system substrate-binding protein